MPPATARSERWRGRLHQQRRPAPDWWRQQRQLLPLRIKNHQVSFICLHLHPPILSLLHLLHLLIEVPFTRPPVENAERIDNEHPCTNIRSQCDVPEQLLALALMKKVKRFLFHLSSLLLICPYSSPPFSFFLLLCRCRVRRTLTGW